jgi:type I restriction enzyme M protein
LLPVHNSFTQDNRPDLRAGFVMASPPFNLSQWRDAKLEADLVERMFAFPGESFTKTQIPAFIWFLTMMRHRRCSNR